MWPMIRDFTSIPAFRKNLSYHCYATHLLSLFVGNHFAVAMLLKLMWLSGCDREDRALIACYTKLFLVRKKTTVSQKHVYTLRMLIPRKQETELQYSAIMYLSDARW